MPRLVEAVKPKETIHKEDNSRKVYSKEFNGRFNPEEIEYLEQYYRLLGKDFDFDTENRRDYARKLAKASLLADKLQSDFSMGRCDLDTVKNAIAMFDMLSKSAEFAACKRKPNDNAGLGSFSEITLRLESSGHPCTRKIEWEKDDIDKTLDEFRHLAAAIGVEE